jgi:hypothetical protein
MRSLAAPFVAAMLAAGPAEAADNAREAHRATTAVQLTALAERIAKLQAQVSQGVLAERSRRAMPLALRDFEALLKSVAAASPTQEIRDNYVLLALLWPEYRDLARKPATRDNLRKFRERVEEVVWVAAKGARLIQEQSRATASAEAIRAATAAELSQRIAKLYLWRQWDLRDEALQRQLREAEENLARTLATLRAAPAASPEVAAELQVAEDQRRFMADAAKQPERSPDAARALEFIAKTGDNIYDAMGRAARLYEGGS